MIIFGTLRETVVLLSPSLSDLWTTEHSFQITLFSTKILFKFVFTKSLIKIIHLVTYLLNFTFC